MEKILYILDTARGAQVTTATTIERATDAPPEPEQTHSIHSPDTPFAVMKKSLCIAVTTSVLASFSIAANPGKASLEELLATAKRKISQQCIMYQQLAVTATTQFDKDAVEYGTPMACDCMPKAVDRLGIALAKESDKEGISNEVFLSRLQVETDKCVSSLMRASVVQSCERETELPQEVTDRLSLCACFNEKVQGMGDEQLVQSAQAAREGAHGGSFKETALDKAMSSCVQEQKTQTRK